MRLSALKWYQRLSSSTNNYSFVPVKPGFLTSEDFLLSKRIGHASVQWNSFTKQGFHNYSTVADAKSINVYNAENVCINETRNLAELSWSDGHTSRFHTQWLRLYCQCPQCKRNITGEANVNRSTIPDQLLVNDFKLDSSTGELHLWLDGEILPGHVTTLPLNLLRKQCYCKTCLHKMTSVKEMTFFHPQKTSRPTVDFSVIDTDQGKFRWLKQMVDVGFTVIQNVPKQSGICLEIAERISPLVYGTYEKMFDVTDTGSTANLAYTSTALPFHMDVVHLEAAPGIQLLHALEFDDCVEGGDSLLTDMFHAVHLLRQQSPADFEVLTRIPVTFSITDYHKKDPIHVLHRKPLIHVDYDDKIVGCAWNPGTEQPLRVREEDVEDFYRAYKKLEAITLRKDLHFKFRLRPGELLMFNNRRFLHSREAYRSNGGKRHLQGTYCSMEELRSKYVILGRKLGYDVIDTIIGNGSAV